MDAILFQSSLSDVVMAAFPVLFIQESQIDVFFYSENYQIF
ncbi:hypothetical protein LEP1GSC047_1819 [Leptospira inadai serovar Lyme str. 10]|uniref:Uncharacterized protein n=1 Tax=Leptospira inadai serovar Lyme str. 10 TaxID=1049790 RepID=V6H9N2_9LEPT|nr:hypothetical protein LEP1GSC047_1819 [Leptospira inadai serovar Lyme str. 10]